MELKNFICLLLLVIFIVIPVIFSIKREDQYLNKLKYLLPSIIFTGVIFVIWDIRFTELRIWEYNPDFISGIKIKNLPLEKWFFFIAIPFCSVYIYEFLNGKTTRFENPNVFVAISLVLLVVFGGVAYFFRQNLYTFFTFFLLAIYFGYTIFRNNFKKNYPRFYISFLVALIPFLLLRGVLTTLPLIIFNSAHITNIHIFTIPIEDLGYFFLLHLMNVTIYEYLKVRQFY